MASERAFNLPLHTRLIEIMDEVTELNSQIEANVRLLNDQPDLAADIRLLMIRCASLVREAVELRTSAGASSADGGSDDPPRSPAGSGSGLHA